MLKHAARSPAHFKHALDHPAEPSDAMTLGSVVHSLILEPDKFGDRFVVMPDFKADIRRDDGGEYANVRATKQHKTLVADFEAANQGRTIVDHDVMATARSIADAVYAHALAAEALADTRREVSVIWDDAQSGFRCKSRLDAVAGDRIVDFKTTRDAAAFEREIHTYQYHVQLAFYQAAIAATTDGELLPVVIIAAETSPPYGVRVARLDDDALDVGRDQYRSYLLAVADSLRTGVWPNYSDPDLWRLPRWARRPADDDLVVAGESFSF
jgi:exodeoxyribonuclease VIII